MKCIVLLFQVVLTCILIVSFGMHSLQIKHAHFAHAGSAEHQHSDTATVSLLGEYMHASDKKIFLVVLLSFLSASLLLSPVYGFAKVLRLILVLRSDFTRRKKQLPRAVFDMYVHLFSGGILHSKVY